MQLHAKVQRDGIVYAATREGYVLPVIDVTNPRFAVPEDPGQAQALYDAFVSQERARGFMPGFIMRFMLGMAARRSLLVKALFRPDKSFLDGVTTYVMKLGAENLVPPFDAPLDRKFAASPHIILLRLRMQQTARLLADALAQPLASDRQAELHLINIGGGPAMDSVNVLLLLNRSHPELLRRRVVIHVLDGDPAGPFFGANALAALQAEGGPLSGVDAALQHQAYDWNDTAPLRRLVGELAARSAIIAASSEGALFEYGSDEAIIANVKALLAEGTGPRPIAGSVTRDDATRRKMIANTKFTLVPRGIEGFQPLAAKAGAKIEKVESVGFSHQVLLCRARGAGTP
jgi:hypothetical protein